MEILTFFFFFFCYIVEILNGLSPANSCRYDSSLGKFIIGSPSFHLTITYLKLCGMCQ